MEQDKDAVLGRILAFFASIGLPCEPAALIEPTFLPGIRVECGGLLFDAERLAFPGDLLHEAGHLAVVPAEERRTLSGNIDRGGAEEMAAIAWSWAALVHLRLAPEVVFHPDGYRGEAAAIIENFSAGRFVGVPWLQWRGMSLEPEQAARQGGEPFPAMRRWLCD